MNLVCKKVLYWGRVQGVGFRYAAQRLAEGYAVAGYVRNLANGQVELLAEGDPQEVDRFIAGVTGYMADLIHGYNIHDEPVQGLRGFRIRG
jgi:acylphosphatase